MTTGSGGIRARRLKDAAILVLLAASSLLLLLYVAFSDATRVAEQIQTEKLLAQGRLLQGEIERFVRPGLPIHQFVGFPAQAEAAREADPLIGAVGLHDPAGRPVFPGWEAPDCDAARATPVRAAASAAMTCLTGDAIRVALPVADRFERVGDIVLTTPRRAVAAQVERIFASLLAVVLAVTAAFAAFVLAVPAALDGARRWRRIGFAFVAAFLGTTIVIVGALVGIYSDGAQARATALSRSLAIRLDDVVAYGLRFDDITGIDALFSEYRQVHPDIRAAALVVDGRIRARSGGAEIGAPWVADPGDFNYAVTVSAPGAHPVVQVRVALPRSTVYVQVARSAKNFAALLVACGLIAGILMGAARAAQGEDGDGTAPARGEAVGALVTPVFFLAILSEHLCYAFLPQTIQAAAAAAGLPAGAASAPFVAYYLAFALALLPAGRLEGRVSARSLILAGLVLSAIGLGVMAGAASLAGGQFWAALTARGLSGIGQGILFIGVQGYLLATASPARKTRAGGVIVFGFQAGMIAGMAIGSLLVSSLQPQGVFTLATLVAAAAALYVRLALPALGASGRPAPDAAAPLGRVVATLLRDRTFLATILLIGAPAKAVLTGIVLFGLPLLLARHGLPKEDIGQMTMLYAGAVILASRLASARADRTNDTTGLLVQGAGLTGLGLILISLAGGGPTALAVAGVTVIGLAHGLVNAPILTHVVEARIAARVGAANAAAAYRLLERGGHVLGPMIVAQVFLLAGQTFVAMAWIGAVILAAGLLFLVLSRRADDGGAAEAIP